MKMKHMKRKKFSVTGRVQGVWFRKSTQDKARELGLRGFVKNEPDGSVYLEAEGEVEKLSVLEDWLHEGPPNARVEKVHSDEISIIDEDDFQIR